MKKIRKVKHLLLLTILFLGSNSFSQDNMLCVGRYWSEDEANLKMKDFASSWNDLESWEKRASIIKQGIIKGMKLDKMP